MSAYRFMLDTNAASALIRGKEAAALHMLLIEAPVCISVITEAELRFGVSRKPGATRLAQTVESFLQNTPVIPWTSATARTYADLRARMESDGINLSSMDLLIAAQAIAENCTLVSADRAFAMVPGLRVMDSAASPGN